MPFRSQKQRAWMFAAQARGDLKMGTADRWAKHTPPNKRLPEHVHHKKKADFDKIASVIDHLPEEKQAKLVDVLIAKAEMSKNAGTLGRTIGTIAGAGLGSLGAVTTAAGTLGLGAFAAPATVTLGSMGGGEAGDWAEEKLRGLFSPSTPSPMGVVSKPQMSRGGQEDPEMFNKAMQQAIAEMHQGGGMGRMGMGGMGGMGMGGRMYGAHPMMSPYGMY